MAIVAVADIRFRPEVAAEGLALLNEALVDTRAFAGNLGVDVLVSQDEPGLVRLIERWESREADNAYRAFRSQGPSPLAAYVTGATAIAYFDPQD